MSNGDLYFLYKCISDLLVNPSTINSGIVDEYADKLSGLACRPGGIKEIASRIFDFISSLRRIPEEHYVSLFELSPLCPLYLGYYFSRGDEDKRRIYMLQLKMEYNRHGFKMVEGELPDYLPVVVEFLALSIDRMDPDSRRSFIEKYVLDPLSSLIKCISGMDSPYSSLLTCIRDILMYELGVIYSGIGIR